MIEDDNGDIQMVDKKSLGMNTSLQKEFENFKVVKEFEAVCWCSAQKKLMKMYSDMTEYSMHFCKEDARNKRKSLCPHFRAVILE